jgi:hypothetical protein
VGFSEPVVIGQLQIFETYNPGAVVSVSAQNSLIHKRYQWFEIYSGEPQQKELELNSRIFKPALKVNDQAYDVLKIILDTTDSAGWSELDAVKMWGWNYVESVESVPEVQEQPVVVAVTPSTPTPVKTETPTTPTPVVIAPEQVKIELVATTEPVKQETAGGNEEKPQPKNSRCCFQ